MACPSRLACAFFLFFVTLSASAQVQKLGEVSFAVPEGWKYEYNPGDDHADMVTGVSGNYCIVALTVPIKSTGNVEQDFAIAWRYIVERNPQASVPSSYEIRGLPGYSGRVGSSTLDNRTKNAFLYLLETGKSFIPVTILTPNRTVYDNYEGTVQQVVSSVRLAPLQALPMKKNITLADLVGDWKHGGADVITYVNSTTGNYAGTSTAYVGEFYTIAADGSYAYNLQAMSDGHVVREKSSGQVEFTSEFIVFHEKPSNKLKRYRFISYQHGLSGASLLTVLGERNEPTSSNISMYSDKFVRDPAKPDGQKK